jgi:hypothetical protein
MWRDRADRAAEVYVTGARAAAREAGIEPPRLGDAYRRPAFADRRTARGRP